MSSPDPAPKLRMAARDSTEELAQRFEREKRAVSLAREDRLKSSLAPFRVGSVPYLNAVPLTRGIEDEVVFIAPSLLAEKLRRDELDAALVSIVEVLFHDRYDILDGIAIASLGEVKSVLLAHRRPLAEVKEIYCDTASLTSVQLLKVLLAEQGLHPEFKPLPPGLGPNDWPDYFLLIGDRAIDFTRGPHGHEIWDLGAAWFDLTRLPFVYAIWALRRIPNDQLRQQLREAKDFGMETLDHIVNTRTEYDLPFRKDYLGWHIHYHLGSDEKRGLAKFIELLRKHNAGPVYDPRFVS